MNYEPGQRAHNTGKQLAPTMPPRIPKTPTATELGLKAQLDRMGERNEELAAALSDVLKDLHLQLADVKDLDPNTNHAVKQTLDKADSVQFCLKDPSLSLSDLFAALAPVGEPDGVDKSVQSPVPPPKDTQPIESEIVATASVQQTTPDDHVDSDQSNAKEKDTEPVSDADTKKADGPSEARRETQRPSLKSSLRPSLSDAGFSWMLEGSRNLSSFVSSASVPPEQTRHQEAPRTKGSPLFGNSAEEKPGSDAEHDELALRSLRGPL